MATANLSVESKDFTLPVVEATAGADGIVVSTLRNDGWITLDPGFLTTAQCESQELDSALPRIPDRAAVRAI